MLWIGRNSNITEPTNSGQHCKIHCSYVNVTQIPIHYKFMSPRGGPAIVIVILLRLLSQMREKTKVPEKVHILNTVLAALLKQKSF